MLIFFPMSGPQTHVTLRIALKSMVRAVAGLALLLIRTGLRGHPTSSLDERK
jgi:hypothetical protein